MRRTVNVDTIRDRANVMLATADSSLRVDELTPEQAFRQGVAALLESILHESGRYAGFNYHDVDVTTDPPTIPDESRRYYH